MNQHRHSPKPDESRARRFLGGRRGIALTASVATAFVVLVVGTVVAVGADTVSKL
jgi:hypothetical protein